ncbi:S41 family peptidase [Sediminibacterium sp.]|uniref:S41 family peptidase n=1 Tax=Sediminibacterium sp. TaxID=1917865 RepID=UPI002733E44B|nr:S41 family peptidase [Sediminibacterium sp.]MDP3392662.1 S41 family peptidase [Sediminibacterium sp.]MDP3566095.1 S41 family peptidase [Sediminibacterium sp.]
MFLQTQSIVTDNYAGWFDKVTDDNKAVYLDWTSNKYAQSKSISTDSSCAKLLQEWISFFKDKHLRIKYTKPKVIVQNSSVVKAIQILYSKLTENQIIAYLDQSKKLDPIEGIYESASYKLGVTKINDRQFHAVILSTTNQNWKIGEVKLVIQKVGSKYQGTFYEGDKSDQSEHEVQIVDNILDFDIVFYEKIYPAVKVKKDIVEYEMSKDRYAPSLIFQKDVAIWKFPSFENNANEQTEYLLKKYKEKLDTIPFWVLDFRNNSGGDYSIGLQLLEYIYTRPIVMYNTEMRMTKSNYDIWYKTFISNYYQSLDSVDKLKMDVRLNKMKANYDKMYNGDEKLTDTLLINNANLFPKKIALLINEQTVSSGELFTILAAQSDKVNVMGSNSGGMIDYGNVVNYSTNIAAIRIQLPTNRYLWLNEGKSIDKEGIKPAIYLTDSDWVEAAIKLIKSK